MKFKEKILNSSYNFHYQRIPFISFCTVCMNRTEWLKKTVENNIETSKRYENLEFVLLNYNSTDDMEEYVENNLIEYINGGILKYYKTKDPEKFERCHAKNMAYRLATGDILINIDADMLIKDGFIEYIRDLFSFPSVLSHGEICKGCISVLRKSFYEVRGYDEFMKTYGPEDLDFVLRVYRTVEKYDKFPDDLMEHINPIPLSSRVLVKEQMDFNVSVMINNFYSRRIVNPKGFGQGIVYKNLVTKKIILE